MRNGKLTGSFGTIGCGNREHEPRSATTGLGSSWSGVWIVLAIGTFLLAGCNGSSNRSIVIRPTSTPTPTATSTPSSTPTNTATATPTPTPTSTPVFAAGASAVGVNCQKQRAWVALYNTGGNNGHGQVVEVDLTANPDLGNPVVATIDLGNNDIPSGIALTANEVLVVAGNVGLGGHLYIFNQSDNSPVAGSPFAFPAGSDTDGDSSPVFDPVHNQAVVPMCDTTTCDGLGNATTGWSFFDLATHKFGPVLEAAEPDAIGLNPNNQMIVAPADAIDPQPTSGIDAIDGGDSTHSCLLFDANLENDLADPDGSTADPMTSLFAVGDFSAPIVTVLNLNGATFSGAPGACTLDEAGTNPNSVDVAVFATTTVDPADVVAVNQVTHQVLVASSLGADVGLISLPKTPVAQLMGPLDFSASVLPAEPDLSPFQASNEPFSAALDVCGNQGLIADNGSDFLVRVDLNTLQTSPLKIRTPLPAGTCFGGFTQSCSNGNGVTYFPLLGPGQAGAGAALSRAQSAHKRHRPSH